MCGSADVCVQVKDLKQQAKDLKQQGRFAEAAQAKSTAQATLPSLATVCNACACVATHAGDQGGGGGDQE